METVEAILPQVAPWIGDSGVCADSPKALMALNDVRELLWDKGDFEFTTEYVCYSCVDCCVTLPSRYKQIRQAWLNKRPLDLRGEWYQASTGLATCCGSPCGDYRTITDVGGYHPVFRDYGAPFYLAIAGEDSGDTGKVLTFEVLDTAQKRSTVQLTVGVAFAKITYGNAITSVVRAVKATTNNRIRVYAIDVDTAEECLIALYEASDVNPSFRKYKMPSRCGNQIVALTKLKFFKLTQPTDLVEFNINALIPGLQAVNCRKNRDNAGFLDSLNLAVLEANKATGDGEVKTGSPIKVGNSRKVRNLLP